MAAEEGRSLSWGLLLRARPQADSGEREGGWVTCTPRNCSGPVLGSTRPIWVERGIGESGCAANPGIARHSPRGANDHGRFPADSRRLFRASAAPCIRRADPSSERRDQTKYEQTEWEQRAKPARAEPRIPFRADMIAHLHRRIRERLAVGLVSGSDGFLRHMMCSCGLLGRSAQGPSLETTAHRWADPRGQ